MENFQIPQWWLLLKTYYVIEKYVGHKLAIFITVPFTLLHLLLTQWWDMRLKHDVAWLWEVQADSRNVCRSKKKYCSWCITMIRIDTISSKNIYNNFQNLLFSKLLTQLNDQTCFGNFTCLQTFFGHSKLLGECYITPLPALEYIKIQYSRQSGTNATLTSTRWWTRWSDRSNIDS